MQSKPNTSDHATNQIDRFAAGPPLVMMIDGTPTSAAALIRLARRLHLKSDDGPVSVEMATWALSLDGYRVESIKRSHS